MSTYDVAFWTVALGLGGGVAAWAMEDAVLAALQKSKFALITGGVLAGAGVGVLVGSRFSVVGTAIKEAKMMV